MHEFIGRSRHRSGAHFSIAGGWATVANVVGDGPGEDHRVLCDHGDLHAKFGRIELRNIDAVEKYAAIAGIEAPQQQLEHGGFSGTGWTYQRHGFTRCDLQIEVRECGMLGSRGVAKAHGGKYQLTLNGRGQACRNRGRRYLRVGRQNFHQPFCGASGSLHLAPQFAERTG